MLTMERVVAATAARWLRSAARRWPATIREEQHAEWVAELHALRAEPGGRALRAWRELRFAASLATTPALEDPDRRTRGVNLAAVRGKGWSSGSGSVLALLTLPLLTLTIAAVIYALFKILLAILRTGGDAEPARFVYVTDWQAHRHIDWPAHVFAAFAAVLCVAVLVGIGRRLGRHLPLWTAHRGALTLSGSAIAAPLLIAGGALPFWPGVLIDALRTRTILGYPGPNYLAGAAVWLITTTAAGWWIARHQSAERRTTWRRIVLLSALAAGLASTIAAFRPAHAVGLGMDTAVLWFPLSLLCPDGWGPSYAAIPPLNAVASQLFDSSVLALLCSCCALAYGAGAAEAAAKLTASGVLVGRR